MTWQWWFVAAGALVLVSLAFLGTAVARSGRKRRGTQYPRPRARRIVPTYGPGYQFLIWREKWEWETVPPPFPLALRRLMKSLERFTRTMANGLKPSVERFTAAMVGLTETLNKEGIV